MKHLISVDDLSLEEIKTIHQNALEFLKNPKTHFSDLKDKILINFFFENSTRTRLSFEAASKRMGVRVLNLDTSLSSLKKGESIIDTAKTLNAMRPDFLVLRHDASGICEILKNHLNCCLINAGDGTNEHPSQALLDSLTILQNKGRLQGLKVAICGDILHSRVAHSNIKLLRKFGCEINVATLPTLMPSGFEDFMAQKFQVKVFSNLEKAIKDCDVVMMLRLQNERMQGSYFSSLGEYFKYFGLTHERLKMAAPKAIVLHPGPINRGVEISSLLADDENVSLILNQVEAGVATRQAILKFLNN
jgi:aspartate carbamoyltransferase catalytic subunit